MGDRFYQQQLKATGECPGRPKKRRRNMSEWTDELKAEVVAEYEKAEPTPENTAEIIKSIAEEYDKTPNGVRMVLTKAGVYVKKAPAAKAASGSKGGGGTRVSKAAAIEGLRGSIQEAGGTVDDAILEKLTGKAAAYFQNVIQEVTSK